MKNDKTPKKPFLLNMDPDIHRSMLKMGLNITQTLNRLAREHVERLEFAIDRNFRLKQNHQSRRQASQRIAGD